MQIYPASCFPRETGGGGESRHMRVPRVEPVPASREHDGVSCSTPGCVASGCRIAIHESSLGTPPDRQRSAQANHSRCNKINLGQTRGHARCDWWNPFQGTADPPTASIHPTTWSPNRIHVTKIPNNLIDSSRLGKHPVITCITQRREANGSHPLQLYRAIDLKLRVW